MAARSYYPQFLRLVRKLFVYLLRHLAQMTVRLEIGGTPLETDLRSLIAALLRIQLSWPSYVESL